MNLILVVTGRRNAITYVVPARKKKSNRFSIRKLVLLLVQYIRIGKRYTYGLQIEHEKPQQGSQCVSGLTLENGTDCAKYQTTAQILADGIQVTSLGQIFRAAE